MQSTYCMSLSSVHTFIDFLQSQYDMRWGSWVHGCSIHEDDWVVVNGAQVENMHTLSYVQVYNIGININSNKEYPHYLLIMHS